MRILVTGSNGQLGKCLQDASEMYQNYTFTFATRKEVDLANEDSIVAHFRGNEYDYCVNCAAYTNVDQAQKEEPLAFKVNSEGVKVLAEICAEQNITLIHISTDYVFDGQKKQEYVETDFTNPINVYGTSKLSGEHYIRSICERYFIVRTSWLYSQYGHNFLNTIIKHAGLGTALKITTEQTGTPTNGNDLANILLLMIAAHSNEYGVYHYSNGGATTWYEFAKEIITLSPQYTKANLASTNHYPTFAQRPEHSVLNTKKIKDTFSIVIPSWSESLSGLLSKINTQP